jgi:hypothetical protein
LSVHVSVTERFEPADADRLDGAVGAVAPAATEMLRLFIAVAP